MVTIEVSRRNEMTSSVWYLRRVCVCVCVFVCWTSHDADISMTDGRMAVRSSGAFPYGKLGSASKGATSGVRGTDHPNFLMKSVITVT